MASPLCSRRARSIATMVLDFPSLTSVRGKVGSWAKSSQVPLWIWAGWATSAGAPCSAITTCVWSPCAVRVAVPDSPELFTWARGTVTCCSAGEARGVGCVSGDGLGEGPGMVALGGEGVVARGDAAGCPVDSVQAARERTMRRRSTWLALLRTQQWRGSDAVLRGNLTSMLPLW